MAAVKGDRPAVAGLAEQAEHLMVAIEHGRMPAGTAFEILRMGEAGSVDNPRDTVQFARLAAQVAAMISTEDARLRRELATMMRAAALILEVAGARAESALAWYHCRRFMPVDDAKAVIALTTLRTVILNHGVGKQLRDWTDYIRAGIELGVYGASVEAIQMVQHELATTMCLAMFAESAYVTSATLATEVATYEQSSRVPVPVGHLLLAACALRKDRAADVALGHLDRWSASPKDTRAALLMPIVQALRAECLALKGDVERAAGLLDALPRDTVPGDLLGVLTMMQAAFAYLALKDHERMMIVMTSIDRSSFLDTHFGRQLTNSMRVGCHVSTYDRSLLYQVADLFEQAQRATISVDWGALGFKEMQKLHINEAASIEGQARAAAEHDQRRVAIELMALPRATFDSMLEHRVDLRPHIDMRHLAILKLVCSKAKNAEVLEQMAVTLYARDVIDEIRLLVDVDEIQESLADFMGAYDLVTRITHAIEEIYALLDDPVAGRAAMERSLRNLSADPMEPDLIEAMIYWCALVSNPLRAIEAQVDRLANRADASLGELMP